MIKIKKADMDIGVIKSMILYLAILLIMIFIVHQIATYSYEMARKASCTESVKNNAKRLVLMGTDLTDKYGSVAAINCRTDYTTITASDDERIKKELADKMVDAWDMFGKGELEIFSSEDETYCVITHVVEFKKEGRLEGFSGFLAENDAPRKDMRYIEYFAGTRTVDGEIRKYEYDEVNDVLDMDKDYAIVFVMDKDAHVGKLAATLWTFHNLGFLMGFGGAAAGPQLKTEAVAALHPDAEGILRGIYAPGDPDFDIDNPKATRGVWSINNAEKLEDLRKISTPFGKGVRILGAGTRFISNIGNYLLIFSAATSFTGVLVGSDHSADWDARLLLWQYEDLKNLECTYLEGSSGYLAAATLD